jgi:hypothetical protein
MLDAVWRGKRRSGLRLFEDDGKAVPQVFG